MVDIPTKLALQIVKLYQADYRLQYYVREIALLVGRSHPTILPYLKELEKERVLTAKYIGKTKVYSLNLASIVALEYISMAEAQATIEYLKKTLLIRKVNEELFKMNLEGTIILFGSYAKGNYTGNSDIDLFYLGKIDDANVVKIRNLRRIYGKTINIKTLNRHLFENAVRRKDPLVKEVIKNHVLLQNPEQFINILWRYYNEIK
ncbi:MAG: nucleotidyltransferase domain-containing protein [archaeon]|nr:nucleotidyltransferase domain-containing protein [archaeon]